MTTNRRAAFAGQFYPGHADSCARLADELLRDASSPVGPGAIVPHAGWIYSGPTAALSIAAIAAGKPETVVIFGATHGPDLNPASVFPSGSWQTPLGSLIIDDKLAQRFTLAKQIQSSPESHRHEHSIEVQLPLLMHLLPDVRIVPVGVRPGPEAPEIGRFCASEALDSGRRVAFLGSTDLTHYGPAFGFEPQGRGSAGIRWAKEVNDRRFIDLIQALAAEAVVPEAATNRNACGAGAVAATISAMREYGADKYEELQHTCSAEVKEVDDPNPINSVGYEAGVFIRPT
ncbi:MAG: AmmeMemoRadiSam system protein B [Phycisphaerae bacterium]|nr:AmmeMemoRadiSam system protein B [Phycisphaerae bacterium]